MCKPLTPDVVAPKELQNNHSYVSSADLHLDSLLKNITWWVVTWSTLKLSKFGGWVLAWDNTILVASPFIAYVKKDPTFT